MQDVQEDNDVQVKHVEAQGTAFGVKSQKKPGEGKHYVPLRYLLAVGEQVRQILKLVQVWQGKLHI